MLLTRFSSCGGPWTLADCRLETAFTCLLCVPLSGVHCSVCSTLSFPLAVSRLLSAEEFLRACSMLFCCVFFRARKSIFLQKGIEFLGNMALHPHYFAILLLAGSKSSVVCWRERTVQAHEYPEPVFRTRGIASLCGWMQRLVLLQFNRELRFIFEKSLSFLWSPRRAMV